MNDGEVYVNGTWIMSISYSAYSAIESKDFDFHRTATMKVDLTGEQKKVIEAGGIVVDITDKNGDVLRANVVELTEDGVKIRMKNSELQAMDFDYEWVEK